MDIVLLYLKMQFVFVCLAVLLVPVVYLTTTRYSIVAHFLLVLLPLFGRVFGWW